MPYDEFVQTALHREFYKPLGIVDTAQATLEASATSMAIFYVVRHEFDVLAEETECPSEARRDDRV